MYTVRPGDTLTHIAARFGVSVEELAALNGLQNVHALGVGAQLRLPTDRFAQNGPRQAQFHQQFGVQAGAAGGSGSAAALERARALIGRAYGDPSGASGEAVGPDSPFMHCAQFVNAVYADLPPSAPELLAMSEPGRTPQPGDVVCSSQPPPWGHVGILTERGTVIHSIPGRGVHESSLAEFEASSPIEGVIPQGGQGIQ